MPQPPLPVLPPLSPGQITSQPNAAVNTADKLQVQILGDVIAAVNLCTEKVSAKPSA